MSIQSAVALAKRLIAKNGRPVTFNQLGAGTDPTKPWRADTPNVIATVTQPAVFLPVSAADDLGFTLTQEELEKRATESILTATGTMDLMLAHQVVDGSTFAILWTKVLKPGPTVVLYAMGIQR